MDEKSKRDMQSKPVFGRLSFFLLWVVMSIGTMNLFGSILDLWLKLRSQFWDILNFTGSPVTWHQNLIIALLMALLTSPIEKILLRLGFGKWIKGWITAGIFGAALSAMFTIYVNQNFYNFIVRNELYNLQLLVWSAILVAPQAWLMRGYRKKAWLFFAVSAISNFLMNILGMYGVTSGWTTIAIPAAMMALNFLWLFRESPGEEKAKHEVDTSRLEDKANDEDSQDSRSSDGLSYASDEA